MQNTWSIGRTWKPREGWSRPVLTDERQHQHSNPWRLDRIFLLQTTPDGNEHCLATRRNIDISASAVRFPGRHRPAGHCSRPYKRRFAAAMAQVRRPVPFRTRKLRPGTAMVLHPTGCGRVARRRTTRTGSPSEHTPQGAFAYPKHSRPKPTRAPGPPRIPMRPTPGTIPGQPRRRGRTTRRVRDRGSPTPGPPVRRADSSPPEGSQKPLGPRRDTPAGAQCVLGGNPLNTR